jgi:hypothetical protein
MEPALNVVKVPALNVVKGYPHPWGLASPSPPTHGVNYGLIVFSSLISPFGEL